MEKDSHLPRHLVAIPDGNRRWARERGLAPFEGHREGMKRFREVKDAVFRAGIPFFTFWGASYDNLVKRSRMEVRVLISLFKREVKSELRSEQYVRDETRVRILGEWREIAGDAKLNAMVDELEKSSKKFSKRNFTLLLGYDGKREMLGAVRDIKSQSFDVAQDRKSNIKIDYDSVKNFLWTGELPAVDFVIRTGGEPHWSAGFMMWHTTDSQFYFTDKRWPAFGEKELKKALTEYARRERRFGR